MSRNFSFFALYTYQVFVCIVGFIGLRRYKYLSLPLRILEWYIISSIIVDIVIDVMIYKKIHTYVISQSFAVIELLLFSSIFYIWRTSKRNGLLVWSGFITYLLIWIIGKFTFEPITEWDNYSEPISQLIQIGFGGWILLRILKKTNIAWKEDVHFWVLSGIVLYAVATFFLFGLFTPMLAANRKLLLAIWSFNNAFIVMQYILFLRAFLCKPVNAGITNTSQTIYKE
jgi:hypothetical protein